MASLKLAALGASVTALLFGSPAQAKIMHFAGTLATDQEVTQPVVVDDHQPTAGAVFTYDDATKTLCGRIEYSDLTGTPTGIHVHQAPRGQPGADGSATNKVVIPIAPGPLTFKVVLNAGWETSLVTGEIYTNIHTEKNSKGEVRATMDPCPECEDLAVECPSGPALPLGVPETSGATDAGASPSPPASAPPPSDPSPSTSGPAAAPTPVASEESGCNASTRAPSGGVVIAFAAVLTLARGRRRRAR